MPTPVTAKLPKPKSEDEFEDFVLDVLRRKWRADVQRNGRRGQSQNGVDLYWQHPSKPGEWYGVQCKNVSSLSKATIENEVKLAESFQPSLRHYYLVTSLDRDEKIQSHCRSLSEPRMAGDLFPVDILFWQDLELELAGHEDLVQKYFKGFGPGLEDELRRYRAEALESHGRRHELFRLLLLPHPLHLWKEKPHERP